jgi:hypothetical protein
MVHLFLMDGLAGNQTAKLSLKKIDIHQRNARFPGNASRSDRTLTQIKAVTGPSTTSSVNRPADRFAGA